MGYEEQGGGTTMTFIELLGASTLGRGVAWQINYDYGVSWNYIRPFRAGLDHRFTFATRILLNLILQERHKRNLEAAQR